MARRVGVPHADLSYPRSQAYVWMMEKRKIGSLEVSLVGLGCDAFGWRIDAKASAEVVDAALEAGVSFFDTADAYGEGASEEFLGRALGKRRKDVIVATKFGQRWSEGASGSEPGDSAGLGSPAYIRQAVEASLRRLGTDYIDLYQMHWPDRETPIADTLGALDDLVKEGKVREIGCSNFSVRQMRDAAAGARPGGARFVSAQNHYSLYDREVEKDVLPECEREGLAFIPYFPLENGLLTGKYRPGQPAPAGSRGDTGWGPKVFTPENLEWAARLGHMAEEEGHSLLELAFSWLAANPVVKSVIAGAKSAAQVRSNAVAAGWRLSPAQIDRFGAVRAR